MPTMSGTRNGSLGHWPDSVTIRRATSADEPALRRLSALDEQRHLHGRVLLAEVDGDVWAAAEIDGPFVVADPFRPSGELALLVAERAALLRARRRQRTSGRPSGRLRPPVAVAAAFRKR
jgi:hypothetical protein